MTAVIRRIALVIIAGAVSSGCTTFSDNDAVARVGDTELTTDEFGARSAQLEATQGLLPVDGDPRVRVDGEVARSTVANWVTLQLAGDAGVVARYSNGIDDLPVACVMAFPVADMAVAESTIAALAAGADWDETIETVAPTAIGVDRQQCVPLATLGPDLSAQIAGMSADDPFRAIEGAPALVIRAQRADELLGLDLLTALQGVEADLVDEVVALGADADIYIDPRIGTFDPVGLAVVPVN